MPEPQIVARLLALDSGIAPGRIFQRPLTAAEHDQCLQAAARLHAAPVVLATPTRLEVPEVERLAQTYAQGGKLSLLIIDSLSRSDLRAQPSRAKTISTRWRAASNISRARWRFPSCSLLRSLAERGTPVRTRAWMILVRPRAWICTQTW